MESRNGRDPLVLHLLAVDGLGGTEVQVSTQAIEMLGRRVEQQVAFLALPGPVFARLGRAGVHAHALGGRLGLAGKVMRLIRLLRTRRVDVIEAYGFQALMIARVAAPFGRRPRLIAGVRGLNLTDAEDLTGRRVRIVAAAERLLSRSIRAYDVNSLGARDFLVGAGVDPRRIVTIPSATTVRPRRDEQPKSGPLRVVCVAGFRPIKRHVTLVRAIDRAVCSGRDIVCTLVGSGPTLELTRGETTRLGIEHRFHFTGSVAPEAVDEHLRRADVFVLCSRSEGSPGSVLEAMSAGLPVIGTDVPGIRDVVVVGETGLLVPVDDPAALAESLKALAADPERCRRLGDGGRARVAEFHSWERVTALKEALYLDVAGIA